ncbi:hypothetical protein AVEN_215560-1 [Araneus ventricosus]|uniref:Uncharacterized protein n=1 Tax=Araneus ventricosus TaxID=182803 RepID=A0A4Y2BGZ0_ARAVE|nr:hypothetical protein AVEN_215560-1 [Araneus ventricosus]
MILYGVNNFDQHREDIVQYLALIEPILARWYYSNQSTFLGRRCGEFRERKEYIPIMSKGFRTFHLRIIDHVRIYNVIAPLDDDEPKFYFACTIVIINTHNYYLWVAENPHTRHPLSCV